MSDLVQRLRSVDVSWSETGEWCAEAADHIEALQADLAAAEQRGYLRGLEESKATLAAQGLCVVPKVPTDAMLEAGDMGLSNAGVDDSNTEDARCCWEAMLAAAQGGV